LKDEWELLAQLFHILDVHHSHVQFCDFISADNNIASIYECHCTDLVTLYTTSSSCDTPVQYHYLEAQWVCRLGGVGHCFGMAMYESALILILIFETEELVHSGLCVMPPGT